MYGRAYAWTTRNAADVARELGPVTDRALLTELTARFLLDRFGPKDAVVEALLRGDGVRKGAWVAVKELMGRGILVADPERGGVLAARAG